LSFFKSHWKVLASAILIISIVGNDHWRDVKSDSYKSGYQFAETNDWLDFQRATVATYDLRTNVGVADACKFMEQTLEQTNTSSSTITTKEAKDYISGCIDGMHNRYGKGITGPDSTSAPDSSGLTPGTPSSELNPDSASTGQVLVPDLSTAVSQDEASLMLANAHLVLGEIKVQDSATDFELPQPGTVLSQDPAPATSVPAGSVVNIVIASGQIAPQSN